jgi:beta-mannosidase
MITWVALLLLLASVSTQEHPFVQTNIIDNWNVNILSGPNNIDKIKDKIYQVSIPTTLHLVLQDAGDIPNPFLKENYPTLKYVSDCNIAFSVNFTVDDTAFALDHHYLVFEGIDTYSDIFLNGQKILSTENAFVKYRANVKQLLKKGVNFLQVKINSTNERDNAGQQVNAMPFAYAQTRKACYQYSWDWAPYLNTMGIWKNVYLESYKEIKLDYVWVRTRSISKERATINFAVALDWNIKELASSYQVKVIHDNKEIAAFPAHEKYSYYDVHINNPELWWPNGIGKPHIYDFTVQLISLDKQTTVD